MPRHRKRTGGTRTAVRRTLQRPLPPCDGRTELVAQLQPACKSQAHNCHAFGFSGYALCSNGRVLLQAWAARTTHCPHRGNNETAMSRFIPRVAVGYSPIRWQLSPVCLPWLDANVKAEAGFPLPLAPARHALPPQANAFFALLRRSLRSIWGATRAEGGSSMCITLIRVAWTFSSD